MYEEAYSTLGKILNLKLKRSSLSPEEEVEKETLILVMNDYKLKVSKLESEKINISRHLSLYIEKDCLLNNKLLPKEINLVKKFDKNASFSKYSKLQKSISKLESAKMKLELEKSNTYPNLKLGPEFETEKTKGKSYQSIGLNISMELPLLNSNSGFKNQALEQIKSAEIEFNNRRKETAVDLESWIEKYYALAKNLRTITTNKELDRKHHKLDKLFKRGVISTALIIETHRQLIEYANTRFDFELGTVEALWNIYKINGTVFTESL